MTGRKRVIVGMSGGVDSSVTAGLLVEQGYDVIGITLNLWPEDDGAPKDAREDACCALGAVEDARRVADRLGIKYYVMNFRDTFEEKVVKDFIGEYQRGRTPNPCVRCNQFIKFDALLARAALFEADYVATGHYVRVEQDADTQRWLLRKAADPSKDQSYVLYVMTQDRLARAKFPLGALTKTETRRLAQEWKLPVANKPESQDICFVPYKRYTEYLEKHAPETIREGPIVDQAGQVVGTHQGIAFHTVGQRRGLKLAMQEPRYVTGLDAGTNTVMVGTLDDLTRAVPPDRGELGADPGAGRAAADACENPLPRRPGAGHRLRRAGRLRAGQLRRPAEGGHALAGGRLLRRRVRCGRRHD